jgi:hypothetical protein
MLLTMGDRELPTAMPSFCWKNLSSTWKYIVLKQTSRFHDVLRLQDGSFGQCVVSEFITDDLYGFVQWYISEKTDNKANNSTTRSADH